MQKKLVTGQNRAMQKKDNQINPILVEKHIYLYLHNFEIILKKTKKRRYVVK